MKITKKYQYVDSINGHRVTFYADTIDQLVGKVIKARQRNNADIPDYGVLYNKVKMKSAETRQVDGVESNSHKKNTGTNRPTRQRTKSRSVSIRDAEAASYALMKVVAGQFVNEEEYKRRLKICSSCVYRQKNSDCMGCGGSGKAARASMNVRSKLGLAYKLDGGAGREFCGFCGCSFSLLLVTEMKNYKKSETDIENGSRPSQCWLRKDSVNYVGS